MSTKLEEINDYKSKFENLVPDLRKTLQRRSI